MCSPMALVDPQSHRAREGGSPANAGVPVERPRAPELDDKQRSCSAQAGARCRERACFSLDSSSPRGGRRHSPLGGGLACLSPNKIPSLIIQRC